MWQVPDVTTAAVQMLVKAAKTNGGLKPGFIQLYLAHEALPDCLLALLPSVVAAVLQPSQDADQQVTAQFKPLLLRVFGDLEGVWADAALQDILLKLPQPAMKVLLGCDELQVASEDTVLYTARKYVEAAPSASQQPAKQQLAPLIRCPHLSFFWLSALAVSVDAPKLLLSEQQPLVKQLLMLQLGSSPRGFTSADLTNQLPGAPSSWLLPERVSMQVSSVQLTWMLDVEDIRAAARKGASRQRAVTVRPHSVTPPLNGLAFSLRLHVQPQEQGAKLGVFVYARNTPPDSFYNCAFTVSTCQRSIHGGVSLMCGRHGKGWPDFFSLGTMAGGWDEAAWAAKGLPTSGQLPITLTVHAASHTAV